MHKHLKELLGGSLIYGLSGMVTSIISVFLIPIYTRVFTPSDYGVLNIVNTTYVLLAFFIIFGLDNSAALWYWDKTEDFERKKTFASWAYFSFVFSIVITAFILLFSKQLSALLLKDPQYYYLFNLMSLNLLFTCLQKVTNIWFRVQKKPVWAVSYALIVSLTTIGLSVLLIVKLDFGLSGFFLAQIGAAILGFIISVCLMYKWFKPRNYDYSRLLEMLRFAAPLVPATVSFWLMNSAGSYFINYYVSSSEVGLYQLGNSLAGVITVATGGFMQAWGPFAFSIAKEENHRETFADIFLLYVHWCGVGLLGVFLFAPEVLAILAPPSFSSAAFVAGLLAVNIIILSLPQIVAIGCALVKTNMPYSKATIFGSVISIILFITLIPFAGKEGAVIATIAGNLFVFLYVYYHAQKFYFIPYNLSSAILSLVAALTLSALGLWVSHNQTVFVGLSIKISLFIGYTVFIIFYSFKIKEKVYIPTSI